MHLTCLSDDVLVILQHLTTWDLRLNRDLRRMGRKRQYHIARRMVFLKLLVKSVCLDRVFDCVDEDVQCILHQIHEAAILRFGDGETLARILQHPGNRFDVGILHMYWQKIIQKVGCKFGFPVVCYTGKRMTRLCIKNLGLVIGIDFIFNGLHYICMLTPRARPFLPNPENHVTLNPNMQFRHPYIENYTSCTPEFYALRSFLQ